MVWQNQTRLKQHDLPREEYFGEIVATVESYAKCYLLEKVL